VDRTRELDEVSEALVGARDELSILLAANDAREEDQRAALQGNKRVRDVYTIREGQLKAANQRIRQLEADNLQFIAKEATRSRTLRVSRTRSANSACEQ